MSEPRIRAAEASDLPHLVRIYNHYVANTYVTFDTTPFTVDERRAWYRGFSDSGPHRLLVADVGGKPAGYASSSVFRARAAYDSTVETTIYLDPECVGRGIGKILYGALLDLVGSERGLHRAYGGIAIPNAASIALHESFGFSLAGTFHEVGFKLGKYWDVSWYEKKLTGSGANGGS